MANAVKVTLGPKGRNVIMDKKFGARADEVQELLLQARTIARELAICFHVGSQAMNPMAYASAIAHANNLIRKSGVIIDALDVGGGFPAAYPELPTTPLREYVQVIKDAFESTLTSESCRLLCEPGRALVAESASILVNVTLRKGDWLYLNDGAYGGLFDAAHVDFPFPVKAYRGAELLDDPLGEKEFCFYGPTCDSIDTIVRPYRLPASIGQGDFIEFGQLGAYGDTMRSRFNGFGDREQVIVRDEPYMSLFTQDRAIRSVTAEF